MSCTDRLASYLRDNNVPFQLQHHALAYTAQEVAASGHVPGKEVAKVVMVAAGGKLAMAVLPAPLRLDLAKASAALGVKDAHLASEVEFAGLFSDCEVGAMPPFGNLYGLPVYVDKSLKEDESIVVPAGTHTDTIRLKYADFDRLVKPTVADLAYRR